MLPQWWHGATIENSVLVRHVTPELVHVQLPGETSTGLPQFWQGLVLVAPHRYMDTGFSSKVAIAVLYLCYAAML